MNDAGQAGLNSWNIGEIKLDSGEMGEEVDVEGIQKNEVNL